MSLLILVSVFPGYLGDVVSMIRDVPVTSVFPGYLSDVVIKKKASVGVGSKSMPSQG